MYSSTCLRGLSRTRSIVHPLESPRHTHSLKPAPPNTSRRIPQSTLSTLRRARAGRGVCGAPRRAAPEIVRFREKVSRFRFQYNDPNWTIDRAANTSRKTRALHRLNHTPSSKDTSLTHSQNSTFLHCWDAALDRVRRERRYYRLLARRNDAGETCDPTTLIDLRFRSLLVTKGRFQ